MNTVVTGPQTDNTAPVIVADGLSKNFPGVDGTEIQALNHITFTVKPGQLTALVGPDGAGKTTLIRMIVGLLKPDSGKLSVLGQDVVTQVQNIQSRISYMPQKFGLYEDLTVQENLDLYADLHGVPQSVRDERFSRMLSMTDMTRFTGRLAGKLSGGMKQKLGLACTLVRTPDLLILDEPSVGVDPLSRRDLWRIVQQLVDEEHLTVLVSTAYMDEAQRCQQIFVFHQGKILAEGSAAQLCAYADGLTYQAKPVSAMRARDLQAILHDAGQYIVDAVPKGDAVWFIRRPSVSMEEVKKLLPNLAITQREALLEDTFMMLLRQHEEKHRQTQTDVTAKPAAAGCPEQTGVSAEKQPNAALTDTKPAIIVRNLVRRFGDFTAVASTSFEVGYGEIFGLLGPNGAGKTTTFRMLCGLLPATSGTLDVAGVDLRTARAQARARVGYVSQKFALYGNLTVKENLTFFGGVYGLRGHSLKTRINEVISQFELQADAVSGLLPAGYKQRLAMAVGLLHQPRILFLDEPTSGIDPLARRAFWRTITALAQSGVTIIITTHFMEEAEYCDRIAIQDAGKLLALGTPQEVRQQAGGDSSTNMDSAFIAIVEHSRQKQISEKANA